MALIQRISPNRIRIGGTNTFEQVTFDGSGFLNGPNGPVSIVFMILVGQVQQFYIQFSAIQVDNRMTVSVPQLRVPGQYWFRLYFRDGGFDDNFLDTSVRLRYEGPPLEPPPQWLCEREAWLTLGDKSVPLENEAAGYVCSELDIGWPSMREVTNNRPDQHGIDDRTKLFGSRVVTAHVVAGHGGSQEPDQITRLFAPFFLPDARPVLHWRINTPDDQFAERTLHLRASEFSAPIHGAETRELHMAWVTPDPYIYDPVVKQSIAKWGSTIQAGRTYPFTPSRFYPMGTAPPITGQVQNRGDAYAFPNLRIYGPVQRPDMTLTTTDMDNQVVSGRVAFKPTFFLDAARYLDINCKDHTVIGDDGRRLEAQLDWGSTTAWPVIPPHNRTGYIACIFPNSTNHISQVVVTWQDAYLAP